MPIRNYYLTTVANAPQNVSYAVWYATWSTSGSQVDWSQTPPQMTTGNTETCAVFGLESGSPPGGVESLGSGNKDLPPPPAQFYNGTISSLSQFKSVFADWQVQRSI